MIPTDGGRILVAGIGNIFFGDDGFGVEVVGRIDPAMLGADVDVAEYGIRGVHLAYDLLDGRHATLILVDALPLGEPPGTLAILEVAEARDPGDAAAAPGVDAHTMSPAAVLKVLETLGGHVERILVVGCQPGSFDEGMGLSAPVLAAVDEAVLMVRELATSEGRRAAVHGTSSMSDALPVR
jgi:hydrogenase maturation protease